MSLQEPYTVPGNTVNVYIDFYTQTDEWKRESSRYFKIKKQL